MVACCQGKCAAELKLRIERGLAMANKDRNIPELDIGDPRDHWISQAHKLANRLRLPSALIDETRAIIESAFGSSWLSEVFNGLRNQHALIPQPTHPFDTLFGVAGECQVVELMELGIYLKHLANAPNLVDVINVMKHHYSTGLLQLAFAYRFLRAAATNVELEPTTDRGKSDICFMFEDRPFLVECYVPSMLDKTNSLENLRKCARSVLSACDSVNVRLRVSIRLKRSISIKESKQLGARLANAVKELTSPHLLRFDDEFASCDVKLIEPADDEADRPRQLNPRELHEAPDAVINSYAVPVSDIEKVRLGEEPRRREQSRLVIWRPQAERIELSEDEYVEALEKRISDKFRQTKRKSDNPGRIVIAQLANFGDDEEKALNVSRKLQQTLIPRHENISAVMLVQRSWVHGDRYQYRGIVLGGRDECSFPKALYEKIYSQEVTSDIFGRCILSE